MKLTIYPHNEQQVLNKIESFNKKFSKLGFKPLTIAHREETIITKEVVYGTRDECSVCIEKTESIPLEVVILIIDGDIPVFNGWKVINSFIRLGDEIVSHDKEFSTSSMFCEHCGTNRLRNTVYLLEHTSGERKQVASTCVKHFVGVDIGNFFSQVKTLKVLIEDLSEEKGVKPSITGFKDLASSVIRSRGLSITADDVAEDLKNHPNGVVVWSAENDAVYHQQMKLVESAIYGSVFRVAKQKHQEKLSKAAEEGVFGNIGDKVELEVIEVLTAKTIDSMYGRSTLYVISTNKGLVKFFSKNDLTEAKKIKASIKKHTEWDGIKQTELTRVRAA